MMDAWLSFARSVEESRETVAAALGSRPSEVVFTAGGTESDNLAVKGIYWARRDAEPHRRRIVTTAVESASRPIDHIPQPVKMVVAQSQSAVTPDQPVDLTAPKAAGAPFSVRDALGQRLGASSGNLVPVNISARHLHISQEHLEILFGSGAKLTPQRGLYQQGAFAAEQLAPEVRPVMGQRVALPLDGAHEVRPGQVVLDRHVLQRAVGH